MGFFCTDDSSRLPNGIGAVKTGSKYIVGGVTIERRVCVKNKDRGGLLVLEDNRV